jgi:hypothetical protein
VILIAFGCDRCGVTAQRDIQRRAAWDSEWVNMPPEWTMQDGFLICGNCHAKEVKA